MPALCNINGRIVAEPEATVPVLDRGFLFGDSVYEVLRTRDGVPFAWVEHLERLRNSAAGIALDVGVGDEVILGRLKSTLRAAGLVDAYVRIIVTRGTGSAPNIDLGYAPGPATHVLLVRPLPALPPSTAALALIDRLRNDRRALDPGIKSGNYLNNVLGLAEAKAHGATDCLFLNAAGKATEASTSNFYVVKRGRVATPPLHAGLLSGTTRRLLLQLATETALPIDERDIDRADLESADEMFLSSTLRDVVPVVAIDGRAVGDGKAGPVTVRLQKAFSEFSARRLREVYRPGWERVAAC